MGKDYFSLTPILGQMKYLLKRGNVLNQVKDRVKWNVFPAFYKVADFPTHIDIESASACQLACPQCTNVIMPTKIKGIMSWSTYKKVIDEASERGVYSIKLSWRGEPMLNPKIWDMVKYAKNREIKDVAFLSNGERMKVPEDLEKMLDSGLDWISFSADGLYETYNRIRAPSKFEEFSSKLVALRDLKRKKGVDKPLVRIQTILSAIRDNPDAYFDYWEPIVDRVNFISDEARSDEMRQFPQDPDYICPAPWQRIVIDHKGNARPCVCDYFERNVMGNVNEQSLYEIWHGKMFEELRHLQRTKQRMEKDYCAECCHGGLMQESEINVRGNATKIRTYVGQKGVGDDASIISRKIRSSSLYNPHISSKSE
ncbi:MAG: radical SAM protein [Nanoarchaeota archaeon]|nr:radical SAM protein [Nanoarchaeota archaeon]